jgi:hypothetical protein
MSNHPAGSWAIYHPALRSEFVDRLTAALRLGSAFYCTWVRARIGEFCRLAHLENFFAENPNDLKPYLRVLSQEIEQVSARNKIQQTILRSFGC